jgi:hypothetical protein
MHIDNSPLFRGLEGLAPEANIRGPIFPVQHLYILPRMTGQPRPQCFENSLFSGKKGRQPGGSLRPSRQLLNFIWAKETIPQPGTALKGCRNPGNLDTVHADSNYH